MSPSIRSFIAIELNETIKNLLARLQTDLKKSDADVRWVQPHNIHLTLKFLGDVHENRLNDVGNTIETSLQGVKAFSFELSELGAFPKIESPRIVWIGVGTGATQIQEIVRRLEEALSATGFSKEKRDFTAHLTLGREKSSINRLALIKALRMKTSFLPISQSVNEIILFKSTLTSSGAVYEVLRRFALAK